MPSLRHRKQPPHENGDVEKGDPEKESQKEDISYDGDEYEALLKFVEVEGAKASHKQEDDADDEGEEKVLWYAPWKKVKVESKKPKKVPDDWLTTEVSKGLSEDEVSKRRQTVGYNELQSPKENQFLKFISYFRGPILYVMEIAVVLAAGLRDWIDFGVIIGILFLNASVGWYQEKQAGDIVAQLKGQIALKALVIRGGQEMELEARELVPGDIVVLEEGSTIPADSKIIASYGDKDGSKAKGIIEKVEAANRAKEEGRKADDNDNDDDVDKGPSICSVDQSAITGESLAADKYLGDIAYYTCGVKRGKVFGIVVASAQQSFVGKTAALVTGSNDQGHFQIVLGGIGSALLVLVMFFIFAVWIGGFFRGVNIATPRENNLLVYALILFIIGVPVGLPCVTTTTMAVGAAYLARRKCIVQKLTAIESLAGVDILCSDKTGTLTANKLTLNDPYLCSGVERDWFMTVAVLASSHNIKSLDPIDKVTILGLKDYPKAQENLRGGWKTDKFTPFDPVSKRIEAQVEKDGRRYSCAKGAPNAILKLSKFPQNQVLEFQQTSQKFAEKGFRSLGVAVKEDGKEWQLLGIMSMYDPPRSDTAATIHEAQDLGVRIKMLTGDAVAIAKETCKQLQLGTNVYDSQRLINGASMTGSDVRDFVEAADGFAEVFPEHKYQVVEMLQQRGHLTAMTGDGVNDAPSLKKADCGIAVEGASDAARSAADVVFLDEGLNSMITAIKVARQIFHRMKAYIVYRIALCIHLEVYLMLSMIILNETIRVDLVVFLAIFADVATIAIAYDRAPYARAPVEWQLPKVWIMSIAMGLVLAAGTWIVRASLFTSSGGIIQNYGSLQEILFLEVALTESWVIFVTRLSQGNNEQNVFPSIQLLAAVFGVDILASIFCIFGWISGDASRSGRTSIVTVVRVWGLSLGVTIVVAIVYFLLNKLTFLGNLGKLKRHSKNEKLENFLTELQRLTIHHERSAEGDFYQFGPASKDNNKDEEKEKKSSKTKDKQSDKDSGEKGHGSRKREGGELNSPSGSGDEKPQGMQGPAEGHEIRDPRTDAGQEHPEDRPVRFSDATLNESDSHQKPSADKLPES